MFGKMNYLFTSESVSEGHPDKVADQISDAVLDQFLAYDPASKVACETLVTTGQVVIAGEVKSNAYIDLMDVTRGVINRIGYNRSEYKFDADACGVLSALHEQSQDINRGVERSNPEEQGAGDQGMMFGYACNETDNYMPLTLDLSHMLLRELAEIRREGKMMPYLRPDAKRFILPADNTPEAQDAADKAMHDRILADVRDILLPRAIAKLPERVRALFDDKLILLVNPTGKFVIGGPHGDTGLTGRKIIVDTYGGRGAHGGGAFSGKDPSKVDRSAAYAVRHIAKNAVAAGIADEMLVQVAYAIGKAEPVSLYVSTFGTKHVPFTDAEIAEKFTRIFDLRPSSIVRDLKLLNPIYEETAAYGHVGREPRTVEKYFHSKYEGDKTVTVELFTWEKLDYVDRLQQEFGLA